jgi:hypothetical protein
MQNKMDANLSSKWHEIKDMQKQDEDSKCMQESNMKAIKVREKNVTVTKSTSHLFSKGIFIFYFFLLELKMQSKLTLEEQDNSDMQLSGK